MDERIHHHASPELTARELEELEAFLIDESALGNPMNLDMLDGFLTALAVGPETLMPSEWLPRVWNPSGEPESPAFASPKQAERIIGLIMRMMNSVLYYLEERPEEYAPLPFLLLFDNDEERLLSARFWSLGFIMGTNLRHSSWEPLFDDKATDMALFIISRIAGVSASATDENDGHTLEFWEAVPELVRDIRQFWMPYRKRSIESVRHSPAAPGCNDSCPCGSGKKYATCCGK